MEQSFSELQQQADSIIWNEIIHDLAIGEIFCNATVLSDGLVLSLRFEYKLPYVKRSKKTCING